MKKLLFITIFIISFLFYKNVYASYLTEDKWDNENFDNIVTHITENTQWYYSGSGLIPTATTSKFRTPNQSLSMKSTSTSLSASVILNGYDFAGSNNTTELPYIHQFKLYIDELDHTPTEGVEPFSILYSFCGDHTSYTCSNAGTFSIRYVSGSAYFRFAASSTDYTNMEIVSEDTWYTITMEHSNVNNYFNITINGNEYNQKNTKIQPTGKTIRKLTFSGNRSNQDEIIYLDDLYFENLDDPNVNVTVIDLPENNDIYSIGTEDYINGYSKYCIINQTCIINFTYSYEAIDDILWLYESDINNSLVSLLNSYTLENNILLKKSVQIATSSEARVDYFAFLTQNFPQTQYNLTVTWITENELSELTDSYNIDSACSDMATPTPGTIFLTMDEAIYSIQCGMRKFGYWLFTPHDSAYSSLIDEAQEMKTRFPLSIFYDLYDILEVLFEYQVDPLQIPLIWYEQSTGIETLDTLEVSTSTIINTSGMTETKYNTFYNILETIVYFYGFIVSVSLIINFRKSQIE